MQGTVDIKELWKEINDEKERMAKDIKNEEKRGINNGLLLCIGLC